MPIIETYLALTLAKALAEPFCMVIEKIRDMAEEELYGEDKIKQDLLELQMKLEMEEITEEEYMMAEAALMERLEEGRRRGGEE
ncbi:MAG: hypothetical protein DDT30_00976 [Dehalococcoidia bacterium]|nr:hypothetical protein [Bacillota bacterium]MBT9141908.1 hypothetical protein [Bacillota bacterium]